MQCREHMRVEKYCRCSVVDCRRLASAPGGYDVLSLQSDRSAFRAVAASYLHVQWIGAQKLQDLRFEHPEPFRHLRLWAMLRDVASYLVRSMHKMPAALSLADVERSDGSRPVISLREWGGDDPLRAVLVVGGHR